MADTRQIVSWALERACPLRHGPDWPHPNQTLLQLSRIQACATAPHEGTIVDGIWITSLYVELDAADNRVDIPSTGIRLDDAARAYGGWPVVRSACRACEANVAGLAPEAVAGCHGWLDVMYPWSDELEDLLWDTVRRHGLEDNLRARFLVTKPLWFGLWLDSPLRRGQCELLLELLPRTLPHLWGKDENENDVEPVFDPGVFVFSDFNPSDHYGRQFHAFFRALRASMDWELPLHVLMAPPGHADLGYLTEFAHCPRCKAEAEVNRWEDVASIHYRCEVCGFAFDPSTTYSSKPDDYDFDCDSLETLLGDAYDDFVIRYGLQRGWTERQMREALAFHRGGGPRSKR